MVQAAAGLADLTAAAPSHGLPRRVHLRASRSWWLGGARVSAGGATRPAGNEEGTRPGAGPAQVKDHRRVVGITRVTT